MHRPNNRILQINNIANTAVGIRVALESRGWQVEHTDFPRRADYPGTFRLLLAQFGFALRNAWRSRAYDLLHIHYGYFGLLGRLSPRPYVLHCHGTDLRANLQGRLRRPTLAALRGAAHVLYATPDLAQYLPEEVETKASFSPNIVNTDHFAPLAVLPTTRSTGLRILFISKLDRTKGMDRMAPVFEHLCADPDIAEVSVFIHGNRISDIALPECSKITGLPRQSYDQMPGLIQKHDIVIGQVQLGAIGMSELEAMACGKPVIAHFSYPEAYDTPPPLHQATDAAEVIRALQALKNPEQRRALGENARAWVTAHHASDAVAEHLDNILGPCVASHP